MSTDKNTNNIPKDNSNSLLIGRTLFFTSIKDNSFDYTLPIKASLNKFNNRERAEAPPSLFEYLCYKMTQKKLLENKINKEVAIISEKFPHRLYRKNRPAGKQTGRFFNYRRSY